MPVAEPRAHQAEGSKGEKYVKLLETLGLKVNAVVDIAFNCGAASFAVVLPFRDVPRDHHPEPSNVYVRVISEARPRVLNVPPGHVQRVGERPLALLKLPKAQTAPSHRDGPSQQHGGLLWPVDSWGRQKTISVSTTRYAIELAPARTTMCTR